MFEVEPLPPDSPLRRVDNVILTPHLVGHTRELYRSLVPVALESLHRILRDEMPRHCPNPAAYARATRTGSDLTPRKTSESSQSYPSVVGSIER